MIYIMLVKVQTEKTHSFDLTDIFSLQNNFSNDGTIYITTWTCTLKALALKIGSIR